MFGYVAYMKDVRPHLAKLDPRGLKVVFIGYEPGSKAYRFYDPAEGRAHVLRDVIFDESTFWQWNNVLEVDHNSNQFTMEYLVTEPEGGAQHQEPLPPPAAAPPELVEFATPRTVDSMLYVDHDDGVVARYRRMEDLLGRGEPPGLAVRQLEQEVESGGHTARDTEP